jgi:hypothetical protein
MIKVFKFKPDMFLESDHVYKAVDKVEAYYFLLEQSLGIKLTEFQKKDVLKSLNDSSYSSPIMDLVECEEVLP